MSDQMKHNLRKKGWTEEDIEKVMDVLYDDAKIKKHSSYKREMNKIVYWSSLLVLAVVNLMIAVVLIPFLLFFTDSIGLYLIIVIIALFFGFMVNILITDIEHIERRHHLFALIFIPVMGLITFFMTVTIANGAATILSLELMHNPILVGVAYVVAFILPYIWANKNVLLGKN